MTETFHPPGPPSRLIIASRKSRLAIWQAEFVRDALHKLYPGCRVDILGLTTRGDQILDRSLAKVGGKGLFVKELELALADRRADLAVHSLKDMPMDLPPAFALAAVLEREDPRDALVCTQAASLADLPAGSIVGTSSLRREAMLRSAFPHLQVRPLRGNLDTRLAKFDAGEYAALILAAAGLKRLGLGHRIRAVLDDEASLPAAGQGALGIEINADRADIHAWLAPLHDLSAAYEVSAERAVSRALGGSCQVPLAAFARWDGATLDLRARVMTADGSRVLSAHKRAALSGETALAAAEALGREAAADLTGQGAREIIAALEQAAAAAPAVLPEDSADV
ncbi:MAG: hydroxymethylbilane synthase [Janthinobacterium lividum]